ncbi:MAG: nucleotidyl transferase AbiEii/AbiGii toxin family protein [Lysobacteraceae bacterium]
MTTADEVAAFRRHGSWRTLADTALRCLDSIAPHYPVATPWALGGGTRLMLAFEHRISDDIDIFVADPNILALLSPRLNDTVAAEATHYDEDHSSLKLSFPGLGEIDFICSSPVIGGDIEAYADDAQLRLEPVGEVIAKKLYHRGARITPRDVFDWWYVGAHAPERLPLPQLASALSGKLDGIQRALDGYAHGGALKALSPMASWERIRSPTRPPLDEALAWAKRFVERLRR